MRIRFEKREKTFMILITGKKILENSMQFL